MHLSEIRKWIFHHDGILFMMVESHKRLSFLTKLCRISSNSAKMSANLCQIFPQFGWLVGKRSSKSIKYPLASFHSLSCMQNESVECIDKKYSLSMVECKISIKPLTKYKKRDVQNNSNLLLKIILNNT
jgi:hypothetical protein